MLKQILKNPACQGFFGLELSICIRELNVTHLMYSNYLNLILVLNSSDK
jgi:hypothetical protein